MKFGSKLYITIVILVLSAPLITSSASEGETMCRVAYEDVPDIQVDFQNGGRVQMNGDLILTAESERYDLSRSGIIFYEYNNDGNYDDPRKVYTYLFDVESSGKSVTYTFHKITTDIEMVFVELVPYDEKEPVPTPDPNPDRGTTEEKNDGPLLYMSVISLVLAIVLLCASIYVLNYFNRVVEKRREGSET